MGGNHSKRYQQMPITCTKVLDILKSNEWQSINGVGGAPWKLRRKLEIIAENDLPPLHVVSSTTIANLGRIPRNEEGHSVDAREVIVSNEEQGTDEAAEKGGAVLVFVSHRWLRPNIYEPDDETNTKASALIEFARWYENRYKGRKIYFWIDRSCISWDDRSVGITTLPLYVAACNEIVIYETEDYKDRAWCRLERVLAFAFMFSGQRPWVIPPGLYAIDDEGTKGVPEPVQEAVDDPCTGETSIATDMTHISRLLDVAEKSSLSALWGPLSRKLVLGQPQFDVYRFANKTE